MITIYRVEMQQASTGRTFERIFDSAIGRALFVIEAARLGAVPVKVWETTQEQPSK